MSDAIPGHGVQFAVELDPAGAAGVFTTVGELIGDPPDDYSRDELSADTHNTSIDEWIPSKVLKRGPWNLNVHYIYGDTVHEGLRDLMHSGIEFGVQFLGPSAMAGAGVDEVIASGFLTNFSIKNPMDGKRTAEITFRRNGAQLVDGVSVS